MSDGNVGLDPLNPSKQPAPVNQPTRPYGEGVALDRLAQSFPQPPPQTQGQQGAQPAQPLPSVGPRTGRPQGGPVPDSLLTPGSGFGPGSRASRGPVASATNAMTSMQSRVATLDALANNPKVSEVTREWARNLLRTLTS